ncbi:MAG: hypothetical protein COV46_06210 [Deltaproteobacteria bacterium CG11_big_fil_rev_8_21_14_0_20_49_13]|nr:MAG: hypothetical protein COV46_06210 [Deltaproteobacteria bacterium CG11_big_fil_rev_8_21_14_0_20_49_13]
MGIESKLATHDRYQIELKLGYTLDPSRRKNKYNVDLFMFIPRSLGMNQTSYTKDRFYEDIQGYIRFKTPAFTFEELNDPANSRSPLTRMKKFMEHPEEIKRIIAEMKLFACTVRVALRTDITSLRQDIKRQQTGDIELKLKKVCQGLKTSLSEFRSLHTILHNNKINDNLKNAFRHTDEYMGIAIDGLLNSFNNTITTSFMSPTQSGALSDIATPLIISEYEHRKEQGFAIYEKDGANEPFLYRKGVLKKIITSILFLKTHTHEATVVAKDFIFAISAGIAMIIATVVTLWAGHKYGATSLPFVLAIVIGYMAKDRIKDWLKLIFSKRMTRWFADYKVDIMDPANDAKIGVCKQAFSFISESKVPPKILEMRKHGTPHHFWIEEEIIKYEKDVILNPSAILKAHTRMRGVTDIIRFNMHRFLERMDEPYERRKALDPATREILDFKFARTYHIVLVLKLDEDIRKVRIYLNQNGILKIEEAI